MDDGLKQSTSKYWPRIVAAGVVLGCVVYFNLTQWQYPYFALSWEWGWPRIHRTEFVIIRGGNQPSYPSGDKVCHFSLVVNFLIGTVLTVTAFWGVGRLQFINKHGFRFHLTTALLLMLCSGILLWLNLRPTRLDSRWDHINVYGWPSEAVGAALSYSEFEHSFQVVKGSLAQNIFVALYSLFLIVVFCESWIAWRTRRLSSNGNDRGSEKAPSSPESLE